MAKAKKLNCQIYIKVDGKDVLCYQSDTNGNEQWFLPEEQRAEHEAKMLQNISRWASDYASKKPNATFV